MTLKGKHALVRGSSRGIGRGIALKLAEKGAHVAVHFYKNEDAAKATLGKIREGGSDGFLIQADVCHPEEVSLIFKQVEAEFGSLDIFVSNARTEAPTFYEPPMEITLEKWDTAVDSQAKAFRTTIPRTPRYGSCAEPEVLYKRMSSEKHFSPLERQKCFPDIQPPALAADLRCFVLPVVSCSSS